jgi:hypothetical protein
MEQTNKQTGGKRCNSTLRVAHTLLAHAAHCFGFSASSAQVCGRPRPSYVTRLPCAEEPCVACRLPAAPVREGGITHSEARCAVLWQVMLESDGPQASGVPTPLAQDIASTILDAPRVRIKSLQGAQLLSAGVQKCVRRTASRTVAHKHTARRGTARHGTARHGEARHGMACVAYRLRERRCSVDGGTACTAVVVRS